MLRRDPTRIELRTEDLADFERAREEYIEFSTATKYRDLRKKFRAATTAPPPTPEGREQRAAAPGTGNGSSSSSTASTATATKEAQLDPIEIAHQERKAKSTRDRILGN